MILELALPPNRGNARTHWRVTHQQKLAYWGGCDARYLTKRIPHPEMPFRKAKVTVAFRVSRKNDPDNLVARAKWPLDWLKKRGYIVDDNPDALEWTGMPTQQVVKRSETGLTITLEAA